MNAPKLSIIIPAFNAGAGIVDTLVSIQAPDDLIYEVIIVDDGSTDNTADIVAEIASADPRVVLLRKKNAGVSAARNEGLAIARGEYVMFIDADDVLLDGALSLIAVFMGEFPEADVLTFGIRFSRCDGRRVLAHADKVVSETGYVDETGFKPCLKELLSANYLQSACAKAFRRAFLKSNSINFDTRLNSFEDFEFVLACLEFGGRLVVVAEPVYEYRLSCSESGSRTFRSDMDQQMRLVRGRIKSFCFAASIDERSFDSLSAHLFVNAVNSLSACTWPGRLFADRVEALRDSREFIDLFNSSVEYPNKYTQLILWAAKHGHWNAIAILASVRNHIRSRTGQPV